MLIVFDLDGTLIDSVQDLAASASELAEGLGGRPLEVSEVAGMVGDGAGLLVRRVLQASGLDPDTPGALAAFLEIYDRRLLEQTRPYEGIPEALALAEHRGRLSVLTNKPTRPTERLLEGLNLRSYFGTVIGGDGPHPRKPDPGGLLALMAEAPGAPVLLVGDSPVDAATARAAGCAFAVARYGFGFGRFEGQDPETPYRLDHPRDLIAILDRFGRLT